MRYSNPDEQSFGTVLVRLRRRAGLTQEELAARCGLSARGIGNLERDVGRPRQVTVDQLAAGLDTDPAVRAELLRAARRARRRPVDDAPFPPSDDRLVGRDAELAVVRDHVLGDGRSCLLLTGEPGIGKSRLLAEAARIAADQGVRVLAASCHRFGGDPYAPVVDALADYVRRAPSSIVRDQLDGCAWLDRLLPELPDLLGVRATGPVEDPAQVRRLMFGAVRRFLANLAGPDGVVLLLDDLQWAGEDGLALLAGLAQALDRVRVVAAYRDTEVVAEGLLDDVVADLGRLGRMTRLRLAPLAAEDTAALLRQAAGALPDQNAEHRVVRLSGGIPLFVVQLGRALSAGGDLDGLPQGLAETVRQRVRLLPERTRRLLDLVAVSERPIDVERLALAIGNAPETVAEELEPASHAALLAHAPGGLRFSHELLREVIYGDLRPARRQALHRKLADALGGMPAALAHHYAGAQDHERTADALRGAAEHARAQAAHETAARYLRQLLDLLESSGVAADQVALAEAAEELAEELAAAGNYDAALAAAERAHIAYGRAGVRSRQEEVTARIGYLHFQRGTPNEGLARLAPALDSDTPSRGRLQLASACNLFLRGQYTEAIRLSTDAMRTASAVGDDRTLSAAKLRCGLTERLRGDSSAALANLYEAAALAQLTDDTETLIRALSGISVVHHYNGELHRADAYFHRTLQLAEQWGGIDLLIQAVGNCGSNAFWLGHWATAHAHLERATDLVRQIGQSTTGPMAVVGFAELLVETGREEQAVSLLDYAVALADPARLELRRDAAVVLAAVDLRRDRPQAAVDRLTPLLDRPGMREWGVTDILPTLAEAQLATGDADAATVTADAAVDRARTLRHALALTEALRVQALVDTREHRWPRARRALDEALSLASSMPSPYAGSRLHAARAVLADAQNDAAAFAHHQARCDMLRRSLTESAVPAAVSGDPG